MISTNNRAKNDDNFLTRAWKIQKSVDVQKYLFENCMYIYIKIQNFISTKITHYTVLFTVLLKETVMYPTLHTYHVLLQYHAGEAELTQKCRAQQTSKIHFYCEKLNS